MGVVESKGSTGTPQGARAEVRGERVELHDEGRTQKGTVLLPEHREQGERRAQAPVSASP